MIVDFSSTLQPADADGYVIEWSADGGEWFAIDETAATGYTDEYPTLGGQQYRIVSYRGGSGKGEGGKGDITN